MLHEIYQLNVEALPEKLATKASSPTAVESHGKSFELHRNTRGGIPPRGNVHVTGSSSGQISSGQITENGTSQKMEIGEIGFSAVLPSGDQHASDLNHMEPRGAKSNWTLSYTQSLAADNASKLSVDIGQPLNCFVTVNWQAAGVADPVKATGRYLKLVSDALRKRGRTTAYLWVQECGPLIGQHAHILLHLPPAFARWFKRRQPGWLRLCGVASRKGHAQSKSVGETYQQCLGDASERESYRRELGHLLSYLLKDAEPNARVLLGIRHVGGFGRVRGKRSSVSQNLRRKADLAKAAIANT